MAKLGKRQQSAVDAIDREKFYELDEAVALLKSNATAKFDETVEISVNLGVDPRHSDQMVRGMVSLPNGTGRNVRVAVFAKDANVDIAKEAGADLVGGEELAEQVQKGVIDFDRCIATPDAADSPGNPVGIGERQRRPNRIRRYARSALRLSHDSRRRYQPASQNRPTTDHSLPRPADLVHW